jgi:hypothetical protein
MPSGETSQNAALRAVIVFLKSPHGGPKTNSQIEILTGATVRTIQRIYSRAIERGFDPTTEQFRIEDKHVEDGPKPGRPTKQTPEVTALLEGLVSRDRFGREKTAADLAGDLDRLGYDLSRETVRTVLKKAGYRKLKTTKKPGLTEKMKTERLQWALDHKDKTLEDWKNVIWTDETSVVLGHRRGGYRVWRKSEEAMEKSCIRERWKGYSEFMFWGCFTYDKKGPCHIYSKETAKERKLAEKAIDSMNAENEAQFKEEWEAQELAQQLDRLDIGPPRRGRPRQPRQWKFTAKTGKLQRKGKGGVDWWRYQTQVLEPKLIPFAKECLKDRPLTIVQEDKAPSHAHWAQKLVWDKHQIKRLSWCGNSPDLNAIEPSWGWLKRRTTRKGAPKTRDLAVASWLTHWNDMPQEKIQAWIERIPRHIKEIIRCEGGNEYREGRVKGQLHLWIDVETSREVDPTEDGWE